MSDLNPTTIPSEAERFLARAGAYRLLSRLFADPVRSERVSRDDLALAIAAGEVLGEGGIRRAVARLQEVLPGESADIERMHTGLFGLLVNQEAPAYEVEYDPRTDLFWRTQQLADIAGFYRAFGVDLAVRDRPDHIAVEAEFLWYLLERQAGAVIQGHDADRKTLLKTAFRSFFSEHFGAWAASFARRLGRTARRRACPYFLAAADLLLAVESSERARLGVAESERRQARPLPRAITAGCDGCRT
ncbi:MAG: molecular chaperone [Acidobacteriota bacterium]